MRILLTGAGGPSAISVWKSLHAGHELHMADMDPCAAGLYLVPAAQRLLLPRGDDPQLLPVMLGACRDRAIDLLIPTVDAELVPLAQAEAEFARLGVKLALAPLDCLRLCRDKHALLEQLAAAVPVPSCALLTAATVAAASAFPLFAKPRLGAGSRGIALIQNRADLALLPQDGSYLLQEWLPGAEYSVDVYVRSDGRVIAAVPRERMKTDSGIAVAARTLHVPDVIDAAVRAAQAAGIRYVANIQFKRARDGVCKLLEINPRFPGTLPLTAAAGIDIPALLVADLSGATLPDQLLPFTERMVVRYWTEHFFDALEWRQMCPA
jgi:carbamoyl-phosphate synthase large subunit